MSLAMITPNPATTAPPGSLTGFSNPRCYAAALNDCCPKISGEHFLSKSILRQLPDLTVSGVPWLKLGQAKKLPVGALEANILCQRHNSALSGLDAVIGDLFQKINNVHLSADRNPTIPRGYVVPHAWWGLDLERWLLKAMLGSIYSGNCRFQHRDTFKDFPPPRDFMKLLFSSDPWPEQCGFYMLPRVGQQIQRVTGLSLAPIIRPKDQYPCAMEVTMIGFQFILSLTPDISLRPDAMYHIREIKVEVTGGAKSIKFVWPEGDRVVRPTQGGFPTAILRRPLG